MAPHVLSELIVMAIHSRFDGNLYFRGGRNFGSGHITTEIQASGNHPSGSHHAGTKEYEIIQVHAHLPKVANRNITIVLTDNPGKPGRVWCQGYAMMDCSDITDPSFDPTEGINEILGYIQKVFDKGDLVPPDRWVRNAIND